MADRAYIKLYREAASDERNSPFAYSLNVLLDNKKVNSIPPGEEILLDVSPGNHSIVVKPWLGAGSNTMEVKLLPGDEIFLQCGWSSRWVKYGTMLAIAVATLSGLLVLCVIAKNFIPGVIYEFLGYGWFGLFLCLCASVPIFWLTGGCKPEGIFYLQEAK